jgi:hypothetical protein
MGNGGVVRVGEHILDERLVDLELVQRQALQIGERRITGAEVIQLETNSLGLEGGHPGDDVDHVLQEQAFGELQLQFFRIGTGFVVFTRPNELSGLNRSLLKLYPVSRCDNS